MSEPDVLADSVAGLTLDATATPAAAEASPPQREPSTPKTPKAPASLPRPFVVEPRPAAHVATLIMLHGFTWSGKKLAHGWMPALAQKLGKRTLSTLKVVWLNAPMREVSCYGPERQRLAAWHDYYTDHGGDEGHPEIEEEINEEHVAWARAQIHAAIDAEAALLGGDYKRVAVGGASQGCCMALDAALSHPRVLGGCFASFGQVYKCTARLDLAPNKELPITAFHGAGDRCIAASLAMRSYAELVDRGYTHFHMHVEPSIGHCEPSDAESDVLCASLHQWGLFEGAPAAAEGKGSGDGDGDAGDDDEAADGQGGSGESTPKTPGTGRRGRRRGSGRARTPKETGNLPQLGATPSASRSNSAPA